MGYETILYDVDADARPDPQAPADRKPSRDHVIEPG